jgi:hypothetical protein
MNTPTKRPTFKLADKFPEIVRARVVAKIAASWCAVLPEGETFYLDEARARRMVEKHGGVVFPPETK